MNNFPQKNSKYNINNLRITYEEELLMGAVDSHSRFDPPSIKYQQWKEVELNIHRQKTVYGNFICFENINTNEQIDRYQVEFFTRKEEEMYYKCYRKRLKQSYIVNAIYYRQLTRKQFCSQMCRASIYIEHIPLRLGDVTDIPYPDNLYLLRNSLKGFALLYKIFGYFQVEEDHICINNYGEVKVWVHCNLSKNHPQQVQNKNKSQCDMVNKIIHLVQINTNPEWSPLTISQYFTKQHRSYPSFQQAQSIIQRYITDYKTAVPRCCESIVQIFERKKSKSNAHIKLSSGLTKQFITINNIKVPKLPIGRYPNKKYSLGKGSKESKNSLASSSNKRKKIASMQNSMYKQQPLNIFHSKCQQPKSSYIKSLHSQRLDERQRRDRQDRMKTSYYNIIVRPTSETQHATTSQTPERKKMRNYNRLETKRPPIQSVQKQKQKRRDQIKALKNQQKPTVRFRYETPKKTLALPTRPVSSQKLQIIFQPVTKKKQNLRQQFDVVQKLSLCFYSSGMDSEAIDPEIAADLVQYL